MTEYSKKWKELLLKKEKFQQCIDEYNKNVEKKIQKQDLEKVFKSNFEESNKKASILNMMGKGYIDYSISEMVFDKIIEQVFYGSERCVYEAFVVIQNVFNTKTGIEKIKMKEYIIKKINYYTEIEVEKDEEVFKFGWNLMANLGFRQALLNYLEKYEKYKEMTGFDEYDIKSIEKIQEKE